MVIEMKPTILIQLALLVLAGALITYHFMTFSTVLLTIFVGVSVVLGNGALFLKLARAQQKNQY